MPAEIDKAEALRRWLLENWSEPQMLVRDVVRLGPNPLRESPKARAALDVLPLRRHSFTLRASSIGQKAS